MNKNEKRSDMAAMTFYDLKDGNSQFKSILIFKAHTKTTRVWVPIMVTFEFRVTFCAPVVGEFESSFLPESPFSPLDMISRGW